MDGAEHGATEPCPDGFLSAADGPEGDDADEEQRGAEEGPGEGEHGDRVGRDGGGGKGGMERRERRDGRDVDSAKSHRSAIGW